MIRRAHEFDGWLCPDCEYPMLADEGPSGRAAEMYACPECGLREPAATLRGRWRRLVWSLP